MTGTPLQERLAAVRATLPAGVELVAVSKYHPASRLREAYDAGQRVFGESHVQEMQAKHSQLPDDIEWHFIGHLQTNKVKYIVPYVSLVHSVDSLKLLREIDRQGARIGRVVPCLLELHLAAEETKHGFAPDELRALLAGDELDGLSHVKVRGLMCMATNTDDTAQVRREFATANSLFREAKAGRFAADDDFALRSWGMSHDYLIAIEEGSNMVRVGTAIFGERSSEEEGESK